MSGASSRHLGETRPMPGSWSSGSRDVLEWFAGQTAPCLALYGRTDGLPLARTGPDKVPAYLAATRQLVALGHRRIVLIARRPRRKPAPGQCGAGVSNGTRRARHPHGRLQSARLGGNPGGIHRLADRLFRNTPPTALIIEESPRLIATSHFLARHGIIVPEQVSLVCTDYDDSLAWCHPAVAHMTWSNVPIVRRIVRWVAAVRKGTRGSQDDHLPGGVCARRQHRPGPQRLRIEDRRLKIEQPPPTPDPDPRPPTPDPRPPTPDPRPPIPDPRSPIIRT